MKYNILKAQSGTKLPLNPKHKNYPKPTPQGEIKTDTTSKIERAAKNAYEDNIMGTPLEGIMKTIVPAAAIATGNPIASNVGLGQLGLGTGNVATDASLGALGLAAKVAAPVIKTGTNLVSNVNAVSAGTDVMRGIYPSWYKVFEYANIPAEILNGQAFKVASAVSKDLDKISPAASKAFKSVVNHATSQKGWPAIFHLMTKKQE